MEDEDRDGDYSCIALHCIVYTAVPVSAEMRAIICSGCKRVFSSSSPPKSLMVQLEFSQRIQLQMPGRFFSTIQEPMSDSTPTVDIESITDTEVSVPRV